jgi:glyoxylase-like metal-dependent hydrolase (beta-lactamase superfamily II)
MNTLRCETLAPDVHAVVQQPGDIGVSNCGIVVGRDGATLVDSLMVPSMVRRLKAVVRERAGGRARRVVHTHGHIDHVGGDAYLPGAEVWADAESAAAVARLPEAAGLFQRWMPRWARELGRLRHRGVDRLLPARAGPLPWDGPRQLALPLGRAHSASDVAFYLPDAAVVFAGDLAFFGVTPLLLPEGDLDGWLVAVDVLLDLPARHVVPGHGPVGGADELRRLRRYLERLAEFGQASWRAGLPLGEAAARFPLGPFRAWAEPQRLAVNLWSVYRRCDGTPPPRSPAELEEAMSAALPRCWDPRTLPERRNP